MAIIESALQTSGLTVYAVIRDGTAKVWNGATFETFNSAHWSTYVVALTEQTGTMYYSATFPGAISAGAYSFTVQQQAGGSPAVGDVIIDRGLVDTTSVATGIATIVSKLPPGNISGFDPTSSTVNLGASQTGVTIGTVNTLGSTAQANVKTQIDTALATDTLSELTGVPSSTPTIRTALMFLFMALRNKRTSTSTAVKVYNASGSNITTAQQSDDGSTYTKENFI